MTDFHVDLDLGDALSGNCPLGRPGPCTDCTAEACRVTEPGAEGGPVLPAAPVQPPLAGNVTESGNVTGELECYPEPEPEAAVADPASAVAVGKMIGHGVRFSRTEWANEKTWARRTFGPPEPFIDHLRHVWQRGWLPEPHKTWHVVGGYAYHILIGLPADAAGTILIMASKCAEQIGYAMKATSNRVQKGLIIWGLILTILFIALFAR